MFSLRSSARVVLTRSFQCGGRVRAVSTLSNNPHIYVLSATENNTSHTLSLLPTTPPTPSLSIGTTSSLPPTPNSFQENPSFLPLLQSVLRENVSHDPSTIAAAATYASPGGTSIFAARKKRATPVSSTGGGAGGASSQGGMGGGGVGGWVHVYDTRNPPAYGRIADPQDILGSVTVDATGTLMEGSYEECKTYRIVTNEGVLGLSDFLREKVVEKLKAEEAKLKST